MSPCRLKSFLSLRILSRSCWRRKKQRQKKSKNSMCFFFEKNRFLRVSRNWLWSTLLHWWGWSLRLTSHVFDFFSSFQYFLVSNLGLSGFYTKLQAWFFSQYSHCAVFTFQCLWDEVGPPSRKTSPSRLQMQHVKILSFVDRGVFEKWCRNAVEMESQNRGVWSKHSPLSTWSTDPWQFYNLSKLSESWICPSWISICRICLDCCVWPSLVTRGFDVCLVSSPLCPAAGGGVLNNVEHLRISRTVLYHDIMVKSSKI